MPKFILLDLMLYLMTDICVYLQYIMLYNVEVCHLVNDISFSFETEKSSSARLPVSLPPCKEALFKFNINSSQAHTESGMIKLYV